MAHKDPLGIDRILSAFEEKHAAQPISKDEYEAWCNSPVTKRLLEEAAIFAHRNKHLCGDDRIAGQIDAWEQVIQWSPIDE